MSRRSSSPLSARSSRSLVAVRTICVGAVAALSLSCNVVLGIEETSLRSDTSAGGQEGQIEPGAAAGSGAVPVTCATHADCTPEGAEHNPAACIRDRCVRLRTPECPLILPQTEHRWLESLRKTDPEPLIFGIFTYVPPALVSLESRNFDLALTEVSRAVGGIPAAGGKRRGLVGVVCQNVFEDTSALNRATDHLIDDLEVPAVIAGLNAPDLEHAFLRKGLPNRVFFISAFDGDPSLATLLDDGLMWHMLPGGERLATVYTPMLDRVIAHLRRTGRLGADELARVAMVTAEDQRSLSALSSELTGGALRFNGRTVRENSPAFFRAVSVTSSVFAPDLPDYSDAIRVLTEFEPHVIIAVATHEFLSGIVPVIEANTNNDAFYVLSPWDVGSPQLLQLLTRDQALYSRIAGVNFAAAEDSTDYDAYRARFDAAYPAFAGTQGYENFYDSLYYLVHAAAAAGTAEPLIGLDLVRGMRRLLSGRTEFSVGPNHLLPAFIALENPSNSIVLNGTMGPPTFDPRTGVRDGEGSVWCMDDEENLHLDVLRVGGDGELIGEFPCFDLDEP